MNKRGFLVVLVLVLFPAMWRLLPHPWNFAPVGALALFCGACFRRKSLAVAIPLVAMLLSDLALGWSKGDWDVAFYKTQSVVYACFAVYVGLGIGLRSFWNRTSSGPAWQVKTVSIPCGAFCGAVVFFLVTNLASWWMFYDHTIADLGLCYQLGLPFFRTTLQGDIFFAVVFFGAHALVMNQLPVAQRPELLYGE